MAALAVGTAAVTSLVPAEPAEAQGRPARQPPVRPLGPGQGRGRGDDIPAAYRPPPGLCRVWLDNVPPAQQPAPTDCASAVRNRPANARVIFGDDYARGGAPDSRRRTPPRYATTGGLALPVAFVRAPGPHGSAAHGPAADDGNNSSEHGDRWPGPDSTRRGGAESAPEGAAARPTTPTPAPAAPGARTAAQDEWEAGYAAGYRDAMQGRRPRVRGVDRLEGRSAARRAPAGAAREDDVDAADAAGYEAGAAYGPGAAQGSAVVVVPPSADPRYFNNGRYPPPGRANGVCLDRDADGWCDDPRFGAPVCRDLDGDGRCDDVPALAAAPFPAALPEMRAGTDVLRGAGSATALRWLGTTEVIARVTDLRRTGSPSRVTWLDANTGALLQVWSDRDGDGVADRVEVYRGGRRVKLIGR